MHVFKKWLGRMLVFLCLGAASYFFAAAMVWPILRGEEFGFGAFALMVTMGIYLGAAYWTAALGRSMIFAGVIAALAVITYQIPGIVSAPADATDLPAAWRMGWSAMFAISAIGLLLPGIYVLRKTPKPDPYVLEKLERDNPSLKGYTAAFECDLGGWMSAEERKRQRAIQQIQLFTLIVGFVSGLAVMLMNMADAGVYELAAIFPGTMAMVMCRQVAQANFQEDVSSHLRAHVAKWLGLSYGKVLERFSFQSFSDMNLVPKFTNQKVIESYSGLQDGVAFQVVECHLSKLYGDKGGGNLPYDDDTTTFRGTLVAVFLPFAFKGRTKVLSERGVFQERILEKHVDVDTGPLGRGFGVYGTDAEEARALVSPQLLSFATDLAAVLSPGARVSLGFVDNTALIAVNYTGEEGARQQGTLDMPVCDRSAAGQFVKEASLVQQIADLVLRQGTASRQQTGAHVA